MTDNVVQFRTRRDEWASAYVEMEGEVFDVVRLADLLMKTWLDELERPITDSGSCMQILLEDLQRRAVKLRARYRPDGDGEPSAELA